MYNKAMKG